MNDNNTYTRYYNFRLEGYVDLPLGINYGRMGLILSVMVQISAKEKMMRYYGMRVLPGGS